MEGKMIRESDQTQIWIAWVGGWLLEVEITKATPPEAVRGGMCMNTRHYYDKTTGGFAIYPKLPPDITGVVLDYYVEHVRSA